MLVDWCIRVSGYHFTSGQRNADSGTACQHHRMLCGATIVSLRENRRIDTHALLLRVGVNAGQSLQHGLIDNCLEEILDATTTYRYNRGTCRHPDIKLYSVRSVLLRATSGTRTGKGVPSFVGRRRKTE